MSNYGLWQESITLAGQTFAADLIDAAYAQRAGFEKIFAVKEVPSQFENQLIRSAQVCDVPHAWRVQECSTEGEVTDELLALGKAAIDRDRKELNAHIITYLGQVSGDVVPQFEFLAAGAIRNKLTKDYQNNEYPIVSRAIVAPAHRGKGLGSLIVEHRVKVCLQFFGAKPKAIHFGTNSEKILTAFKKIEQELGSRFVYIGDEVYRATDGSHVVRDYLCFMPWFTEALLAACDELKRCASAPDVVATFRSALEHFCTSGIEQVSGSSLSNLFEKLLSSLPANYPKDAYALIAEVFLVKDKIGARDPR